MRLQDAVDRDDVREVMARPEFAYPRSLWERITDWIGDRLADLLPGGAGPGGSFGGGIGTLVGWAIIFAGLAAVVVLVVVAVLRRVRLTPGEGEPPLGEVEREHRRRASDWAAEAAELEAAGQWKLAVRARHRELVRTLVDRGQVADLAGRTTGELRDDLHSTTPSASEPFDTACLLFELPWYADLPTGPDESARFRAAAAAVLAAPVEGTLDRRPVVALTNTATGVER
jgi:hypothetical protein